MVHSLLLVRYGAIEITAILIISMTAPFSLAAASESDRVKALYRRGRAHAAVWDIQEAKDDLQKAAAMDPSLSKSVAKELKELEQRVKEKEQQEKASLRGMFG